MQKLLRFRACLLAALALLPTYAAHAQARGAVEHVKVTEGQMLYEIIGQVINFTPSTSTQFGYYTYIKGVDSLFAAGPQNETTAAFMFFRETSNVRVINNGVQRIISRTGTTTMYLNATPGGSFANPNSFRAGSPIQTSTLRQQVIVNTATQTFTVVNEDTITSTRSFLLNGQTYELGKVGDLFVTTKAGVLNTPGSLPTGWFAGYSVGAKK